MWVLGRRMTKGGKGASSKVYPRADGWLMALMINTKELCGERDG